MTGFAGSAFLSVGGGSIADLFIGSKVLTWVEASFQFTLSHHELRRRTRWQACRCVLAFPIRRAISWASHLRVSGAVFGCRAAPLNELILWWCVELILDSSISIRHGDGRIMFRSYGASFKSFCCIW